MTLAYDAYNVWDDATFSWDGGSLASQGPVYWWRLPSDPKPSGPGLQKPIPQWHPDFQGTGVYWRA